MKHKKYLIGFADFETTVFEGQTFTEVWSAAVTFMGDDKVYSFHSIGQFFDFLFGLEQHVKLYFHNLKFDGSFILNWLLNQNDWKQAYIEENGKVIAWQADKEMFSKTYKYSISDMGQWYSITLKKGRSFIAIYDSLKLLPFSLKEVANAFDTEHKKLEMEYTGFRYAGCPITPEEQKYIDNDVLVLKEAMQKMLDMGHNKMTIGSNCLAEYRRIMGEADYKYFFPDLKNFSTPEWAIEKDVDEFIRKAYKGGWCYVVPEKANKIYHNGVTCDVNSLYPSMMLDNPMPVCEPHFWTGSEIPDKAKINYYFIRVKTRFYIKKDKLPCIQIKNNMMYKPNDWLTTSDIYDYYTGKYYKSCYGENNEVVECIPELTLTCTDWKLIQEHYNLEDTEILGGVWFYSAENIFKEYIEKYKKIKLETNDKCIRTLAKLFLNNLYGKMASSDNSSFKVAYLKEDGSNGFYVVSQHDKKTVFIPCGCAITSYARNFTIRSAQKNYYGADKRGFIYADTDSIHCDLSIEELKDIPIHHSEFSHWKVESQWDYGIFARQKTYIEHIVGEDNKGKMENVEPYLNIKCAGMPPRCKQLLEANIEGKEIELKTEAEKEFMKKRLTIDDFKTGLIVPSNLKAKNIRGGVLLVDTVYEMH